MTPDVPDHPRPAGPPRARPRSARTAAIALSLLAHAALLPALILAPDAPPTPPAPPLKLRAPRRPPPPEVPPVPVAPSVVPLQATAVVEPWTTVGEAQLAGALTAASGSGGGGGGSGAGGSGAGGYGGSGPGDCDLVTTLQSRLRADPEVRAAVRQAHIAAGNRALLVWNGDWVRVPGQSGKGLAGVRQAIALEVAFATEACRARPMRGLVLITFADGPGAPRLALGTGAWRWRDLLGAG